MEYETVIRAIIDKERESIGDLATRQAGELDCITIEEGELTFTDTPGKDDVQDLLDRFKQFQGRGALGIARRAMRETLSPDDTIDLPDAIIPREIKEQRFVQGI